MKYDLVIFDVLIFSVFAKTPKKKNEQIVGEKECLLDGDFHEGLQICVYDSALSDLIKEYNKKIQKRK